MADELDETNDERNMRVALTALESLVPFPVSLIGDMWHRQTDRWIQFVRDLRQHLGALQEQVERRDAETQDVIEKIARLIVTPQRPSKVEALRNVFVAGVRTGDMTTASEIVDTIERWDDRHVLIVRALFNADRDGSIPSMDREDGAIRIGSPDVGGKFLDDLLHEEIPSIDKAALKRVWTVLQNGLVVSAHPENLHGLTLTKGRSHLKGVLTEWGRTVACFLNDSIDPTYVARGQHASLPPTR